jgi:hypothetical protein
MTKSTKTIRATRKAQPVTLTPGQKAAATKRRMGLDLTAIANKAVQTRRDNIIAAEREAAKLHRANVKRAKKAAATRASRKAA